MIANRKSLKTIATAAVVVGLGLGLSYLVTSKSSGISEMSSPAYAVKSSSGVEQLPIDAVSKDEAKLALERTDRRTEFVSTSGISVVLLK